MANNNDNKPLSPLLNVTSWARIAIDKSYITVIGATMVKMSHCIILLLFIILFFIKSFFF